MDHVENVVRIPIGGGEEPEPSRTSSPPPDLITLAAGAAIGLVALAVEAAVQILQAVSATPDRDGVQGSSETVAMLTGAALGFAVEAARTAAAAAELGRRTAGPPASFLVGNVFDGPWRAGTLPAPRPLRPLPVGAVLKRLGPSGLQVRGEDLASVLQRAYASFADSERT